MIALVSVGTYLSRRTTNPLTGRTQHISVTEEQEIAMGLQAAPEMAKQFGGLAPDPDAQNLVDTVGAELVAVLPESAVDYPYDFHVLNDDKTVNAFALPGGQVFITTALLGRLESRGQLAGVLAHEIGHVVGRHSAERIAKAELTQGLVGAATVAGSESQSGARTAQAVASMVGNMVNLKYGRGDELESDSLGVLFMVRAGYDPNSMKRVMEILREASGGGGQPEFMSSHPDPGNRIVEIERAIKVHFPDGLPPGLKP
ncbi:MAG: M48 family metallopeptidase [bacterium]|nr:M48 family metallopeptidase [bacterium]